MIYDAQDRMIEQTRGSSHQQIVYGPDGMKLALMNGQTLVNAFVKLPGGARAVYNNSSLAYYRHSDHMGSSRLSTTTSRTKYYDVAYAPYGEEYNGSGTTQDLAFTDQNQDTTSGGWATNLYDFMFREYRTGHGRWTSPDPSGRSSANPASPQTWNRYAYVANNPLSFTDSLGLNINAGKCSGDGYSPGCGGGGGCDPNLMDCGSSGGSPSTPGDEGTSYYLDGLQVSASTAARVLASGTGVECPNDVCSGFSSDGQYGEFFAFAGGTQGYYNPSDLSQGINEANGHLFTNSQYNAYILATYGAQIDAQRQALAAKIAASSGGKISYQQAYDSLNPSTGHLQGGNYNFAETIYGPGNLTCGGNDRCNGIHFPSAGFVHLDTSNPFTGPGAFLEHGFVDLFLGNFAYTVIPRPWP
jgi:RHS repeat-associated protein